MNGNVMYVHTLTSGCLIKIDTLLVDLMCTELTAYIYNSRRARKHVYYDIEMPRLAGW